MKLVTYQRADSQRLGAVVDETVVDLADLAAKAGKSLPGDIISFIEQSPSALETAKALVTEHAQSWPQGVAQPLADVKLLAPVPRPTKGVFGVGLNYAKHVDESARTMDTQQELPTHPVIFTKPATAVVGPDANIEHNPRLTKMLDWEAELGVVIGRKARNVSEDEALDYVFGYTCLNDISARDMRHGGQWSFSKGQDTYCPMGPWLVTADEIDDPHNLDIRLTVNGEEKQNSNTRYMIFKTNQLIAHLASGITLEPGDVIATGTPEGVGISYSPPQFLKDGDVVEMHLEGIGSLRNRVVEVK